MNKKALVIALRLLVFGLFILSAVAKMFPLWAFEKQLVDLGLFSWCLAPYAARAIIGLELAIGVAIIQPHFLKRIVIPVTIALLVAFCIHLGIEMVKHGAMNGNCGCFGQLIPMTPLEATIKNVLTILMLVFLYRNVSDKPAGQNRFSVLLILFLGGTLLMFTAFPFCPCGKEKAAPIAVFPEELDDEELESDSLSAVADSNLTSALVPPSDSVVTGQDSITSAVPVDPGPAPVKSRFSSSNTFSGKRVNLDKGKRIVCFFAAGCDHCREAARELRKMREQGGLPPVYVYFMDEETFKIPEFFEFAGREFPYTVLDIPTFWTLIGPDGSTPGVFYLWNGNIRNYYVGTEDKAFKPELLKKAIESGK
ncbi:MAG: TlpA family protein disulfide reductase [Bacteroidota bacterium]